MNFSIGWSPWPFLGLGTFGDCRPAFDGRGNYSVGFKEQIVFPEIDYDKVDTIRGLDVTITTTAQTNEEGEALLRGFNFPLRK